MEFVIDLSVIPTDNPAAFGWWFFKTIGWIYPVFLFVWGIILIWQNWIRNKYRQKREYILLAVDIPKANEQTPKAVENIFSHLAGAHQPLGFLDTWWFGEINNSFSFEIVSLGGYIQFIIHFVKDYRDLVEAIIYAQYPDAEITEIEDYTKRWNIRFPNDKYDIVGAELALARNEVYPLITYEKFEDSLSQELKDPMASMLEALTRIGPGEEIWVQFVLTPADNDWGKKAEGIVNKIAGAKGGGGGRKGILAPFGGWISEFDKQITGSPEGQAVKKDEPYNLMLYLTAGQKDTIAAIEHKTSWIGFHTKIRYIYLAEKSHFSKPRGVQTIYGSFKQFNDLGLNSLKPNKLIITWGIVFFKNMRLIWRKNKIFYRYKNRGHWLIPGQYGFILNTEELASLWHFPVMTVKAPLVKKTESKKAEPPMSLPTQRPNINPIETKGGPKAGPPPNLPVG